MKKTLLILAFAAGLCAITGPVDAQSPIRRLIHRDDPTPRRIVAQTWAERHEFAGTGFVSVPNNAWADPQQFVPVPGGKTAAPVAADSKKLGPVACAVVRMHLRREYRAAGKSFAESVRLANQADDETINGMVADAEKVAQAKVKDAKFGAIGDGSIIQAIIDFFKSPAGAALLQALIQMLIHLIGGL